MEDVLRRPDGKRQRTSIWELCDRCGLRNQALGGARMDESDDEMKASMELDADSAKDPTKRSAVGSPARGSDL